MQKLFRLSVIVLLIASAIFFAACGKNNDNNNTPVLVTSVTVTETSQVLLLRTNTYIIVPIVLPQNAANKELQFTSMNPSVATVDATGLVTGVNAGTTNIVIKSTDGSNKQATVSVRIFNQAVQLAAPNNFTLSGGKLTWSAVNNAPAYEVTINGVAQPVTSQTEHIITGFNVLYSYQVRAKGDDYIYLSSIYTNPIVAKILSIPANFTHNVNEFSWQAVSGAQYYEVNVNGAIVNNDLNTTIQLDLSSPQTYNVKVRAIIEELNAYSSEYTETITIVRLNVPQNVAQQDGGITWSPVEGATRYIVEVNGTEYETPQTNYKLPVDAAAIMYTFRVKAAGSTLQVLSSVYSLEFSTQKLETPQNLRIQQGKIMWDAVSLAQSYSLELNGQIVQISEATEFELLNNYLAGLYTIKVIANGNSSTFTNSNYSSAISATKLAKPMQVAVSSGQAVWLPVPNATRYKVIVGQEEFITENTYFDAELISTATDYLLTVQAQAEHYLYSQPSIPVLIHKLQAPTNFRVENGLLRWDTTTYASNYEIVAGSHIFTTGTLNGYYLTLPGGTSYDIKIRSIGDNRKHLNSEYSSTIVANKLSAPQNLRLENGYIVVDLMEGVLDYILEINNVAYIITPELFPYYLGGTPNETYNIRVMARGNSDNNLNSDYTSVLTTYQLPKIQNIKIENSTVYWNHIEGVSTYEVFIRPNSREFYDKNTDIHLSSNNTFDLTSIDSGKYYVKVRAQGYLFNTLASIDSNEVYFERLNIPVNFRVEDGLLRWGYVQNATKYLLEINGAVAEIVNSEFHILDESYDVGEYSIRVAAHGDGLRFITSEWSELVETSRMESPQNVRVVDGFIEWDPVANATVYLVYIDGTTYLGKQIGEEPLITRFDPPFAYPSGLQYFKVYAAAETILASKSSTPFLMNKMQSPSNLRIENKIIKWDSVLTSNNYRLFINDSVIETTQLSYDLTQHEGYGANTYAISIMALGDMGDGVGNRVNSDYSSQILVTVMSSPSGLSVQGGLISWAPTNGAINYELRVYRKTGENEYELLTIDPQLLTSEQIEENPETTYLLGDNYEAGEYAIDIRAIGDNINFITSDFSSQIFVTKLPAPQAPSIVNGLLTYGAVDYSSRYEVFVKQSDGFITANYYFDAEGATVYELPTVPGLQEIFIRAIGDNTIYLTSDFTQSISATKLVTPTNFRVENGILRWNSVPNASEYILNINHQDYYIGLTSSYELPNALIQGNYQIKIKARGTNNQYLNSSFTSILNVYKMDAVTNLRVENGVLTWNGVNAPNGYSVIIINQALQETIKTLSAGTTSYVLPSEYVSGNYYIYIQTKGNSVSNLNSIKVGNFDNTAGFQITKLAVPANLRLYEQTGEYYLTWDEVQNAEGYRLVVVKGENIIVDEIVTNRVYKIEDLEVGVHYVSVRAIGDSVSIVNSDTSPILTVTQPSTPTGLTVQNGMVSWNASTHATEYRVYLVYNEVPQAPVTVTTTYYYLTDLGLYDISVQAFYSGSLASEETQIVSYEFNLFAGGNGSVSTPFLVSNQEQLRNVRYNPTAHYVLTNNIILSTTNFVPIGTFDNPFIGNFNGLYEGDYYSITSLTINSTYTYSGLFGYIGTQGVVRNLILTNANITSPSQYTGIIAGYNLGTINRVSVHGTVRPNLIDATKPLYAGGLVGYNQGIIERALAQAIVEPSNSQNVVYGGGIAGYNNGYIYQSGAQSGSVVIANYAGGVTGYNNGLISQAYNKGSVTATIRSANPTTHAYAGGIAGYNLNTDTVTISHSSLGVGEFVGGRIINSYNHGAVSATSNFTQIAYAGGIAGFNGYQTDINSGDIKFSYSTGNITASNSYSGGQSFAGGIAGVNSNAGKLNHAYYLNTSASVVTNIVAGGAQTGSKTETEIRSNDFVQNFNTQFSSDTNKQPWTSVDANTRATLKWELVY